MRALVVDDSRAMRMIVGRTLRACGYDVVEGGDGHEALAALQTGPLPAVAMVDWHMPRLDGLGLVRAVRERSAYDAMPLVMVTTENEAAQVQVALAAGAQEYLFKPFTPEALTGKLRLLGLPAGA